MSAFLLKFGKAIASKGGKAVGEGMKVLGDNSRDFLAATMAFQEVGKSFKVAGPAMSILGAQFQSDTMKTRMDLMISLMEYVQSDGFQGAMDNLSSFVNGIFIVGGDIVEILNTIQNSTFIKEFNRDMAGFMVNIGSVIEKVRELLGLKPKEETTYENYDFGSGSGAGGGDNGYLVTPPEERNWWEQLWYDISQGLKGFGKNETGGL